MQPKSGFFLLIRQINKGISKVYKILQGYDKMRYRIKLLHKTPLKYVF